MFSEAEQLAIREKTKQLKSVQEGKLDQLQYMHHCNIHDHTLSVHNHKEH